MAGRVAAASAAPLAASSTNSGVGARAANAERAIGSTNRQAAVAGQNAVRNELSPNQRKQQALERIDTSIINLRKLLSEVKPENKPGVQADLNAKILERSQVNSGNLLTGGRRKRQTHTRSRRNRRNTKKNRKNRA